MSSRLVVSAQNITAIGGASTISSNGNRVVNLLPGETSTLLLKFSLPRTSTTGQGSTLLTIATDYIIGTGPVASMTPVLTQLLYSDTAAITSTAIPLTQSTAFTLTANVAGQSYRALDTITSPAIDNQAATTATTYVFTVAVVNNSTTASQWTL